MTSYLYLLQECSQGASKIWRFDLIRSSIWKRTDTTYRRYPKKSPVSNFALSLYCMNGSIEGRCTNYTNSSVCNSDFITRSVILEFFKVIYLPSIDPFMHLSEKRIIWHTGGFFMTTIFYCYILIFFQLRLQLIFTDSIKYMVRFLRGCTFLAQLPYRITWWGF